VDTGYLDADLLVRTHDHYQVDLCGPARGDCRWQNRAGQGFATADFKIDWQQQQARCPQGKTSVSWSPVFDARHHPVIKIKFATADCSSCSTLSLCTRSQRKRRSVTVRPQRQYEALQAARQREKTEEFKVAYARRAGIEGTMSQGVRAHGLRRARYIGIAKTHLQHLMIATAINFKRICNYSDTTFRKFQ
jgi:transposase